MGLITANSDVRGVIVLLLYVTRASSAVLYTYPFGFFNTSLPDVAMVRNGTDEYGIVQISACNAAPTGIAKMIIAFGNSSFSENAQLGEFIETYDVYSKIKLTAERIPGSHRDLKYGVDISSDSQIFVYGIKSDLGSSDGFLVPPLTVRSTEFFIAGWKNPDIANISTVGESGILVAGAFPDTCVEIYRITDGYKYKRLYHDIYLQDDLWMSQIVFNDTEETTGLYVNSSKPINVFSSVSCAMINRPPCDYMVEQILPVADLGKRHIVPPIDGRSTWAGYIVRVVATNDTITRVSWDGALFKARHSNGSDVNTTYTDLMKSEFVHIDVTGEQSSSLQPLLVTCTHPCVVMQYNKGNAEVQRDDSATDMFMMLVVPEDHFVDASCFRTAKLVRLQNISDANAGYNINGDFDNYISVVIKTSKKSSLLLDNEPFQANWSTVADYSAGYTQISSGSHTIRTTDGSLFEAYVYGHSPDKFNTVGYGFPISYKLDVKELVTAYQPPPNITRGLPPIIDYCRVDNVSTGSLVFSRSNEIVVDTLNLMSNLSFAASPSLTQACKDTYLQAFLDLARNVFMEINSRLCEGLLCPYLRYNNNTGIVVPSSDDNPTSVFVAFDVEAINSSVSVNAQQNGGTVHIQLPYAGFYDTELESFAVCRADIRDLLSIPENWFLYGNNSTNWQQLLRTPTDCPSITFSNFTAWIPPCYVWY